MSQDSPILAAHPEGHPTEAERHADAQTARAARRDSALSRWDNEGGALATQVNLPPADIPELTNAELVHLRIRVIALENLLVSMLARASDTQITMGGAIAAHIVPRTGITPHPLTEHAAQHMRDLLARALHYRESDIG